MERPNEYDPNKQYEFAFLVRLTDGIETIVEVKRTFDQVERIGLAGEPWPPEFPPQETVAEIELM